MFVWMEVSLAISANDKKKYYVTSVLHNPISINKYIISIYNTAGWEVFAIFCISSNFHEDVLLRGLSYKWAHISCLHLTCNQTQFTGETVESRQQ